MKRFRPGLAFADYVLRDVVRGKVRSQEPPVVGVRLHKWLGVVVAVAMMLLLVRLVSLQLISGSRLRLIADENRIRKIKVVAPRGKIWDRHGEILADNRQVLTVQPLTFLTVEGWERRYPLGLAAAHVIGYLGEVGRDEVGLLGTPADKYILGDMLGRAGVEQQYERWLRGRDGGRLVEVDNLGQVAREMGSRPPQPGQDVRLTLDASLQQVAWVALGNRKGAVVATNPNTGEILVLTSSPSFDPNSLSTQYSVLSTQSGLPFLNRAIGGVYAPGSTFKMVSTVAALAEGKLSPSFTYTDTGSISVGKFAYTNWYYTQFGKVEGLTDWTRALTRSVDTFFYKVGEYIGPDLIARWADILGLGVKSNVDLPGEVAGLIPTPAWKEEAKREKWFLGNTYHMAIGQADLLVTPIQVNMMTGVIAAGGKKCQPHLVKSQIPNPKSQINSNDQMFKCSNIEISPEILDIVRAGMVGACSPGGTAFPLFDFSPQVACKTGTAEYVRAGGKIGTHAWLTAFAPADDPTIAITALVEGGGEGSRVAAPIVRQVLAKYFGVEDHYNYAAVLGEGE